MRCSNCERDRERERERVTSVATAVELMRCSNCRMLTPLIHPVTWSLEGGGPREVRHRGHVTTQTTLTVIWRRRIEAAYRGAWAEHIRGERDREREVRERKRWREGDRSFAGAAGTQGRDVVRWGGDAWT
jgi:hypothetical protein